MWGGGSFLCSTHDTFWTVKATRGLIGNVHPFQHAKTSCVPHTLCSQAVLVAWRACDAKHVKWLVCCVPWGLCRLIHGNAKTLLLTGELTSHKRHVAGARNHFLIKFLCSVPMQRIVPLSYFVSGWLLHHHQPAGFETLQAPYGCTFAAAATDLCQPGLRPAGL